MFSMVYYCMQQTDILYSRVSMKLREGENKMNHLFFEGEESIKTNKFIVSFCTFMIALSLCACGDNGMDMETAYQMVHGESSVSDMESQSDDEISNWYVSADEVDDDAVTEEAAEAGNGGADDEILEILEESADPEYDLDSWVGKYEFGEFIDCGEDFSPMFYAYDIEIYKENDRYYADIEVNGHMVGINLRAKLYGNDEWVSLVIDEYYPEHIVGYSGMENSVFLSMERRGEDIYTYWGIMTPLIEDQHMTPGIYLEKETGEETGQTENTEETDELDEWVGEYAFSEETASGDIECFYHLDIYEKDGCYYGDLVITGNGMDVCVKTQLHGDAQWAGFVLEEYYPEHKSGLENMENMVLLSLRRQGENLYTYWGTWDVTKTFPNGRNSYDRYYYHSHLFFETIEE